MSSCLNQRNGIRYLALRAFSTFGRRGRIRIYTRDEQEVEQTIIPMPNIGIHDIWTTMMVENTRAPLNIKHYMQDCFLTITWLYSLYLLRSLFVAIHHLEKVRSSYLAYSACSCSASQSSGNRTCLTCSWQMRILILGHRQARDRYSLIGMVASVEFGIFLYSLCANTESHTVGTRSTRAQLDQSEGILAV